MSRATVTLKTRDGQTDASVFRPDSGKGPWSAVLVYQDGLGIRPALFELGERIAQGGYLVLLPDLFYRGGPYQAPDAETFSGDPEFRKQWYEKYIATATKANVRSDTEAFLAFLAAEPDVRSLSIGTTGYCMGGGLSLAAAGYFPDRVIAAASYHGGKLATDDPDSPHLLAPRIRARVYVAGAVEDASFPDQQKQRLIDALQQAGVQHAVETYEGAKHGWVPSDSAVYNQAASERHYQTLLALFDATLKSAPPKN
ncbi:dienelactone hydrolase family protein [Sorangium sp. KYC3313]|uniref:dienelactone hydrolase family protein n=1 Tax=Sorangium sp. KYC3313 TaxID=3449740 RepID=UPI003F8B64C1